MEEKPPTSKTFEADKIEAKNRKENKTKLKKLVLLSSVFTAFIVFLTIFYFYKLPNNSLTGLGVYAITPDLKDWKLVEAKLSFSEIPVDVKKDFILQNVSDAAIWHYKKDKEDLYMWIREYKTKEDLAFGEKDFSHPLVWVEQQSISLGDSGAVGIYKPKDSKPVLLLYFTSDRKLVYLAYYNNNGKYDSKNIMADKNFLLDLAKKIYAKF
ncbi:MAG: hypothetical protein QW625_00300 [Candidatus Nanoarchaeia archaeon]